MSNQNIRHLDAYLFPADEMATATEDLFVLLGEYTEDRVFNPDGTKVRRTAIFAHGTRERVMSDMEERYVDNSMVHYRSRSYGDDYFRNGITNALDDATEVTDDVENIVAVTGHRENSPRYHDEMEQILTSGDWNLDEEYDGLMGRATLTPAVMDELNRVDRMLEGDKPGVFRRLERLTYI